MTMPAWSYSSLSSFENCARRHYLTKVAKTVKEQTSTAMLWGNTVHKALELRVAEKKPLPEDMQQWEPMAAKLASQKGKVFTETKMCLTKNLTPTTWFAKDAWARGIVDVGVERGTKAVVLDYKTGSPKPDSDQLKLFAAFMFHLKPYLQEISTGFIWLAHGSKITKDKFKREQLPEIWQDFAPRIRRLELAYENNEWRPTPSGLCNGWCPCSECEFYKAKK